MSVFVLIAPPFNRRFECLLQVGPHRTLLAPVKEITASLGVEVLSSATLMKGSCCLDVVNNFFATLLEHGVDVDLKGLYQDLGASFYPWLPKHPFIRSKLRPYRLADDEDIDRFAAGPIAGRKKNDGIYSIEVRLLKGDFDMVARLSGYFD